MPQIMSNNPKTGIYAFDYIAFLHPDAAFFHPEFSFSVREVQVHTRNSLFPDFLSVFVSTPH